MSSVCFYFQAHQPVRLKNYSFFDIGVRHDYEDEEQNENLLRKIAQKSYLPANQSMLKLIEEFKGDFKISFSITGVLLDKLEELGLDERAIESYRRLLFLDPTDPADVNYRLARLLQDRDPATARRHVLEALAEAPRCREAHRLLSKMAKQTTQEDAP